jgi:threonyl-tRNA synthetase
MTGFSEETMDALPDLVWEVLGEKGVYVQMKYSTHLSDAMPKPRRKFVMEDKAWDELAEACQEAVKRLRAQMVKEVEDDAKWKDAPSYWERTGRVPPST